ncbi:MAG: L,D-transpeptidase family protein [Myxococcales bacterium]|nr:L,D-transpeptidase family protein [Myxococcales bacterium]
MNRLLRPLIAVALTLVAPCASHTAAAAPTRASADKITRVRIAKQAHSLELFAGDRLVARYSVAIGPGGAGPKLREGDKVTPTGRYHVVRHQPSRYKTFLRLDYPNATDRARFAKLKREGQLPRSASIGGDIGIHGPPVDMDPLTKPLLKRVDWTLGCIAVNEDEITEISSRVADGTVVDIDD